MEYEKGVDRFLVMLYDRSKLVRFTGVPLILSGVWRLTLKTNSGLKQNNVPHGWARSSGEGDDVHVSFFLS